MVQAVLWVLEGLAVPQVLVVRGALVDREDPACLGVQEDQEGLVVQTDQEDLVVPEGLAGREVQEDHAVQDVKKS